jgi:hypothetical protein
MKEALEYLNSLILSGYEYPEAEYKTVKKFRVNTLSLRNAYDMQDLSL